MYSTVFKPHTKEVQFILPKEFLNVVFAYGKINFAVARLKVDSKVPSIKNFTQTLFILYYFM
jgi:hypothetical protein